MARQGWERHAIQFGLSVRIVQWIERRLLAAHLLDIKVS